MMQNAERKLFGTDGIRGQANTEPMCVDTVLRVGRAAACVFRRDPGRRHSVVIGKDTRLSGYMFETALAAGLCSMGVDVILVGPMPTPAVAFITAGLRADAGVVISASHNAYEDNGLKFFGPDGFKLADRVELEIEKLVFSDAKLDAERSSADRIGKAKRLDDARGRYISHIKNCFPKDLDLEGMKIIVDCANGAAYKVAPAIFEELGAEVIPVGVEPDGENINQNLGALHPRTMQEMVKLNHADAGIALDGDADRLVVADETGELLDGDDILSILASEYKERNLIGGGVVGTVMTNLGFEKFLEKENIPFFRAPVGDRYVVELMKEKKCPLGGEPSGHLVSFHHSTTGDGLLSAILVLGVMRRQEKKLSVYRDRWSRYPQVLRNVKVREKKKLEDIAPIAKALREAEGKMGAKGRILLRYSGTEPKARVMVEGEDSALVGKIAGDLVLVIEAELGLG